MVVMVCPHHNIIIRLWQSKVFLPKQTIKKWLVRTNWPLHCLPESSFSNYLCLEYIFIRLTASLPACWPVRPSADQGLPYYWSVCELLELIPPEIPPKPSAHLKLGSSFERESFQFGLSGTALAWRNSNGNLKIIWPILSQLYALGLCSSLNCITRYWNIRRLWGWPGYI